MLAPILDAMARLAPATPSLVGAGPSGSIGVPMEIHPTMSARSLAGRIPAAQKAGTRPRVTFREGGERVVAAAEPGATLLDAYAKVNRDIPVRDLRFGITHSSFMTRETVEQAARLGVVLDIQPIWLYLDTRTLVNQFGYDRLRYFQPLKTIFAVGGVAGGGSDHMLKIGDLRAINPYNPFLAMWTTITRRAKYLNGQRE